jgi:AbrB family looped-hinge helix DNA binding protein
MSTNQGVPRLKVFGSTMVSPKGQVVIPANARKELNIGPGDTLLACGTPHGEGLLLLKVEAVEKILSAMSEQAATLGKLLEDYRSGGGSGLEEDVSGE